MTCSAFIATSIDGYIAKPDGNIDWLHNPAYELSGEDFGYSEFMNKSDALVMGRNTYELVLSFPEWPYNDKPVYVLSNKSLNIPHSLSSKVTHLFGNVDAVLKSTSLKGHTRLYIDGGKTIQSFIACKQLDELIITRIPILLGRGIPLFGFFEQEVSLTHINTLNYDNGFVQSHYIIDK